MTTQHTKSMLLLAVFLASASSVYGGCCQSNWNFCGSTIARFCELGLEEDGAEPVDVEPTALYSCAHGEEPVFLQNCPFGCESSSSANEACRDSPVNSTLVRLFLHPGTTTPNPGTTLPTSAGLAPFVESDSPQPCANSDLDEDYFWCQLQYSYPPQTRGRCVPKRFICDGDRDCYGGTDERNCSARIGVPTLAPTTASAGLGLFVGSPSPQPCLNSAENFWCLSRDTTSTGRCIPKTWKCDGGVDCFDGSDELGCSGRSPSRYTVPTLSYLGRPSLTQRNTPCPMDEFKCTSGECIPMQYRCNGIAGCVDNSDEENCPAVQASTTSSPSGTLDLFQDTSSQRPCKDFGAVWCRRPNMHNVGRCVPASFICDGGRDCFNGVDEANCPGSSNPTDLQSAPPPTVNLDSPSSLEELVMSDTPQPCRDPTNFWCRYDHGFAGRCLPASWRCDGVSNCFGGTDEVNCPNSPSTSPPLAASVVGLELFEDAATEQPCRDPANMWCKYQYNAGLLGRCVYPVWRCDGKVDCYGGTDEQGCP